MNDSILFFLIPTAVFQGGFIFLAYQLVGASIFTRPHWVLGSGIAFMVLATLSKAMLLPLATYANPIFSSIPTAITAIEVSSAAIGGSLVAAAFMLKAQILHNKWKLYAEDERTDLKERLAGIDEAINELKKQRDSMTEEAFTKKLDDLLSRKSHRRKMLDSLEDEYERRRIL